MCAGCRDGPAGVVSDHRVEDGEQLPRAGDEGEFGGLAGSAKALVVRPDDRVPAAGARGASDELGQLFVRERAELGELGQQGGADDRADPGQALQQVVFRPPDRALLDRSGELFRDVIELALEPADVLADPAMERPWRDAETVLSGLKPSDGGRRPG